MDKNNSKPITKIVIWSIAAFVLIIVLAAGIILNNAGSLFNNLNFNFGLNLVDSYNDSGYIVGDGEIIASELKKISVHWNEGSLKIVPYRGDSIVIDEESEIYPENKKLRYKLENGNLDIRFRKPGWYLFDFDKYPTKNLVIKIPQKLISQLRDINVNTVSCRTDISELNCSYVQIETVSGNVMLNDCEFLNELTISGISSEINIENLISKEIDIETVSGNIDCHSFSEAVKCETVSGRINFKGEAENLSVATVSGNAGLIPSNSIKEINFESVSGSCTVDNSSVSGFTAELETVSGKIISSFEGSNKYVIYKNGSAKYDFETVSGDIYLK